MMVSIVIPAYNEERYLGRCLAALARQTCPAGLFEVIVVDNGSTDGTAEIAHRYGARVVFEPRKGVARARQAGFSAARGEVIASTDADTVVPPFWVARIVTHFRADPALGAIYGPVHWPDGRPIEQFWLRYPVTWVLWASNRVRRSLWWGSNFAVRREVFQEAGGFPVDWHSGEDTYLSLRVSRIAPVRFDPDLAVHASPRRVREGWHRVVVRSMVNAMSRFVLRRPPRLPMTDIR
ncbi:MAG: glycosyltransferase family 2 protein [Planctomycetes bacterium]|nr:glycosyltransferase family 2 protein [Planctomycetota bacterium]